MLEDHIGKVYNRWTVLGLGSKVNGKRYLNCQCICGNIRDVRPERVVKAKSADCRCRTEILPGAKFYLLTLVKRAPNTSSHSARWECLCDCGNTCVVFQTNFTRGLSKSCGCLAMETRVKHGLSKSKTYDIWVAMKQRTTNPNISIAHHYIDRGIGICDSWLEFENFLADMGEKPDKMSLDRIDNDKGYCKENCRWVSQAEQMRNTRSNYNITAFGETKCITDWSRQFDISQNTIRRRTIDWGWSIEKALTEPVPNRGRRAQKNKALTT